MIANGIQGPPSIGGLEDAIPHGRALVGSLLYGLFNFAGSFGLIYYGLLQVHAGLGKILQRRLTSIRPPTDK